MNQGGLAPLVVNITGDCCFTHVLLYAKMLKETETEETKLFCAIFIIGGISIGGGGPGYAYGAHCSLLITIV